MALDGVFVLDLTHVVAGPMATRVLRDLGARVVKVESGRANRHGSAGGARGDVTRYFEPRISDRSAPSAYFAQLNGGKESILLDLSPKGSAEDRALFDRLLARADVLVENFRPGVLAQLGYGWDVLHRKYPKLVVASVSGFGQSGPYAHRKAVDTIVQGMSGFIAATGYEDKPVKVGTTVSDLLAGVYCATGVCAALHKRAQSGEGSRVDVAMLDTSFAFHAREYAGYHVRQAEPPRMGNTSPIGVYPFDVFECKGGESFSINCSADSTFPTFCNILRAPHIAADPRFAKPKGRWEHMPALRALIQAETRKWDRAELLEKCFAVRGSASFPVGPVNSFADIHRDPQLRHRGMLRATRDGRYVVTGNPIKIDGGAAGDDGPAMGPPELNADGDRIRAEFAAKL